MPTAATVGGKGLENNMLEQQQCETSQRKQPAWTYLSARGYYFGTETGTNYQREKPLMSTQTISRVPSEGRSLAEHPGRQAGQGQQPAAGTVAPLEEQPGAGGLRSIPCTPVHPCGIHAPCTDSSRGRNNVSILFIHTPPSLRPCTRKSNLVSGMGGK